VISEGNWERVDFVVSGKDEIDLGDHRWGKMKAFG
jgi:hypothetical protein